MVRTNGQDKGLCLKMEMVQALGSGHSLESGGSSPEPGGQQAGSLPSSSSREHFVEHLHVQSLVLDKTEKILPSWGFHLGEDMNQNK